MKKVSVKIPAKINFTLDVLGVQGKFHKINSLVASVNVFDEIIAKPRNDKKIKLVMKGIKVDCPMEDNNAFKAASYFITKCKTNGVDIVINKNIPVGGGLGGSSADIAGVLVAMEQIYKTGQNLEVLASKLGSDTAYMVNGGYAVISGRGEKVERKACTEKFHLLALTEDTPILAKECYKKFDRTRKRQLPTTALAVNALLNSDLELFYKLIKNDLESSAEKLSSEVTFNLLLLKHTDAQAVLVAGSGPTVLAVYKNAWERNNAYKKLYPLCGKKLLKLDTIPDKE